MFTTTIDKDGTITIKGKLNPGTPSKSGKTLIVGGTGGFEKTGQAFQGKPVSISLNITVPNNG